MMETLGTSWKGNNKEWRCPGWENDVLDRTPLADEELQGTELLKMEKEETNAEREFFLCPTMPIPKTQQSIPELNSRWRVELGNMRYMKK